MKQLVVSPTLNLPLDVATETTGILGKKGSGKSNAMARLAEQMAKVGVPWVVVDPKGDWWGIRSSANGKSAGLSVVVFGGRHGDVPLEPTAGALVADLILGDEDRGYLSCVLDVSQFTISEQRRFLLAFGERLFRRKDEERVLHLFLEEAHEYLPQNPGRDMAQLVSTWQRIVKQGRFKGLGVTVASQRSAALNKDVLTQVDSLVCMRVMSPQDRAAVKGWVEVHVGGSDVLKTLHELKPGEAWMWSPDRFPEPKRFRFAQRETFDSGATPKVGQVRRAPATLADVDLAAIKEAMNETIEKARAEDPKELHRFIASLQREIERLKREGAIAAAEPVEVRVEVPVLSEDLVARLESALEPAVDVLGEAQEALAKHRMYCERLPRDVVKQKVATVKPVESPGGGGGGGGGIVRMVPGLTPESDEQRIKGLDKSCKAILNVLAQFPQGRSHSQLALLTGYRPTASTIGVALSKLRKAGLVEPNGIPTITQLGRESISIVPLPSGHDLVDYWMNHKALDKSAKAVLRVLLDVYPGASTHQEICAKTGYSPEASTIGVALSKLRKLEIVEGFKIADDFATMIGWH